MSSVEKFSNVLGDMKQEVVTAPFLEKKSQTKDGGKVTDELEDMIKVVVTIRRKGLYKFEGQSKGSIGWFKLDIGFLKTTFSKIHS